MAKFAICKCFYTDNYFIRSIQAHMRYESDEQFKRDYGDIPQRYSVSMDSILSEVKEEKQRRHDFVEGSATRRSQIQNNYVPLRKDIFNLQERFLDERFLSLWRSVCDGNTAALKEYQIEQDKYELYQFPVFKEEFCRFLMEEIANFQKTDLPRLPPNTMNIYGLLLDEIGFTSLFDTLRAKYLTPLAALVYPDWTGTGLDSHRVFTVSYKADAEKGKIQQRDLALHYDNAEVTLNVSLNANTDNTDYEGGEIGFGNVKTGMNSDSGEVTQDAVVEHKFGWGIFHRARQMHKALSIEKGHRSNLILWMRASSIRNRQCPMCWKEPKLINVSQGCYGDGFTN